MADSQSASVPQPLFSFGVVADVQYADKDNGEYESRIQRYREAPNKLQEAVNTFNSVKQDLLFALTLGDIIDGNTTLEKTRADFHVILEILCKLDVPTCHLLGNHCLSLPRDEVLKALNMPARYYQTDLKAGWKLVVLDSMDMSLNWPEDTENYKAAADFLKAYPLGQANPQMSLWNGGIGSVQLSWLAALLKDAERDVVKLIVAGHHPVVGGSALTTHLVWNHQEVSLTKHYGTYSSFTSTYSLNQVIISLIGFASFYPLCQNMVNSSLFVRT
ncbi:hypothetical protein O6H91_10G007400 [Diphasiastrum complanatum]|uniref:Uncharacterized protein n=1 Tax=Diphasiastrum complanatum TaxID=34168 RepID=A0ACC2CF20_DIPCM|nr:hypothetical protein O6H91_10G007400 [Diphasiastrum complanatum]